MKVFLLCLTAGLAICAPLVEAQTTSAAATSDTATVAPADPAAATGAWLRTVPADKRARSDAYFEGKYWILLWNFLLSAGVSVLFLASGLSARLRDFTERTTRFKSLQPVIYVIPYTLILFVVLFPWTVYSEFFREHSYGLANQSFGPWIGEQLIALVVDLVASCILIMGLYAVFRRAPRTWWLWGTGVAFLFLAVQMLVAPVFIAPLFNTYKPLSDPKISRPILAMASANQIPVREVFEVDASRQSKRVSANVSGLFGTTRISLNDNLLEQCSLPEVRAVMAHEMGHYVLNHGFKLILYFTLLAGGAFVFTWLFFDRAVRRWGVRWRVRGIADPAGLPLLTLFFSTYFFLITPLSNTAIRVTEREADAFGLNTAREADGFAKVALKLGTYRKLDPGPLEEIIFFDHPSGRARIRMAMDWKAANLPAGDAGTNQNR